MAEKMIQCGDQQLWVVSGPGWTLPVSAIPVKMDGSDAEYLAVSDIIGLTPPQYDAVNDILASAASSKDEAFWFVPAAGMASIAVKAPGINAGFYVKWNGESPAKPSMSFGIEDKPERPDPAASTKAFLDHVTWRARSMAREDVLFLWQIIVEEMPAWLTERRKPLSFGYFTLWAVPYRANWKQILLAKFPNIASTMRMPRKERDARLSLTDVEASIHHTDLIEFHTDTRTVGWSIECAPTKHWGEFVKDAEYKRLRRLGPTDYAKWWDRAIWKLTDKIYDIFGSFVLKTILPCAEPVEGRAPRVYSLGACCPLGKVMPTSRDLCETSVVYYDASQPIVHYGEPKSLAQEALVLPKVQPLRFADENVRDDRRVLSPAAKRAAGAAGLLVPADACGEESD